MKPDFADMEIRFVSHPRYVCAVRQAVEALAVSTGMAKEDAANIALAIDEALANVIKHGYDSRSDRPIFVRLSPVQDNSRRGLEIVIEDECEGVDLNAIKSRPLDEVRPGGLGVHLIQHLMDEVAYSHRETGAGVRLRMCKFTTSGPTSYKP